MAGKKIRIVLDTNWYISATINKRSRRIIHDILTDEKLQIIYSDEIVKEYQKVIARDKFKKIITVQQAFRFMYLAISRIQKIAVKSDLTGSRDINDNFLLSLSVDGKADYLITGDVDLLVLEMINSTKIITLNNFLEITSRKTQ